MFAFGRKRGYCKANPVADFTLQDAGGPEFSRVRVLTSDELRTLFRKMRETENLGRENELAFKIILATCVRKCELVKAQWFEIDLDNAVWILKPNRTKTRAEIAIPLAPPVVAWFRELKVFAGRSPYVLPARRILKRRFPHISPDTLNVALGRVNHGLEHFTVHDERRTARTHLAALGVPPHVADRALNHKVRGTRGIYDRYDYFEERRDALTKWAKLIVALEKGDSDKVIHAIFGRAPARRARVA